MEEKKILRQHIRGLFAKLSTEDLEQKSHELSTRLQRFLSTLSSPPYFLSNDFIFGAYAPMSDEAQWHVGFPLQKSVQDTFSDRTCFPAMDGEYMRFYQCAYNDLELRKDFFFPILCPPKECPQVEPPVLLIPGRAFSMSGQRLGRGKAYYDNYLRNYKGIKIGICLEMQLVSEVPVSDHDCPVDFVVTEFRLIDATKQHK